MKRRLKKPWKHRRGRRFGARALRAGLFAVAVFMVAVLAMIGSLRWIDPFTSSIIVQQNLFDGPVDVQAGARADNRDDARRAAFDWRPLEQISAPMALAVVAAEDQRFLDHYGLDFVELYKILRRGTDRPRGASTITQQVAKNLFLWSGRSYTRKIIEAGLAVYIDFAWGKRRVLEVYLNVAQFGPHIYGVESAGRHFFGKNAATLNRHEAARLAAVLPNPNSRSAANADATVVRRQRWILGQMRALGGEQFLADLR